MKTLPAILARLVGRELRAQGYNMSLAGGVNIARELRSERTFEYLGEIRFWQERWWGTEFAASRPSM